MHVVFLKPPAAKVKRQGTSALRKHRLRCKAYAETCEKYKQEIRIIQQYQPGWVPRF